MDLTGKGCALTDQPISQNDVVIRSGRKIAVGDQWWEIRDNGEPIKYTDYITEARLVHGTIYLSFGACFMDANNEGIVDIAARLRMDLAAAQSLHNMLGQMISNALTPTDTSKAN
ncbi:hypothetical protein [Sinorhizobium meliloti]|uniref:hypothetical protein n=1 Tax=Rhizobium meliloti TaxID=382 RepID=UPI000FDC746E|nr:hypothetical protein [Sinorhizobium meliloti]RVP96980.1 hypothetical protein CN070_24095 [Sinorhizobium meliloti]